MYSTHAFNKQKIEYDFLKLQKSFQITVFLTGVSLLKINSNVLHSEISKSNSQPSQLPIKLIFSSDFVTIVVQILWNFCDIFLFFRIYLMLNFYQIYTLSKFLNDFSSQASTLYEF